MTLRCVRRGRWSGRNSAGGMTFIYVSGAGTDSSEHGRVMWARVKGETENALLAMPFKSAYMFRPGAIVPLHVTSKTTLYRVMPYGAEAVSAGAAAVVSEVRDDDGAGGTRDACSGEARLSEAGAGGGGYCECVRRELGTAVAVNSWIEVSEERLAGNFRAVADAAGTETEVLAVVKANAYGHGAEVCGVALARAGAEVVGCDGCG